MCLSLFIPYYSGSLHVNACFTYVHLPTYLPTTFFSKLPSRERICTNFLLPACQGKYCLTGCSPPPCFVHDERRGGGGEINATHGLIRMMSVIQAMIMLRNTEYFFFITEKEIAPRISYPSFQKRSFEFKKESTSLENRCPKD